MSSVSLVERKGQQVLVLVSKEGTFSFRSCQGVEGWYELLLKKITRKVEIKDQIEDNSNIVEMDQKCK